MTPAEIQESTDSPYRDVDSHRMAAAWLREIALQLALLNERLTRWDIPGEGNSGALNVKP